MCGLVLDVFGYTPTGNQQDPPSTSFSRAELPLPSGVRLRSARYARLRSASPRRGEAGWKKDKLQKENYTGEIDIDIYYPQQFWTTPLCMYWFGCVVAMGNTHEM